MKITKILKNISILYLFTSIFYVMTVRQASAFTQDGFTTCLNPQQVTVKAQYDSGDHGIPGNTQTFNGNDTVYQSTLSSSIVVQCFCPSTGQGIQTNWENASDLSTDEINVLESQGWVFVPDGSAWGLDPDPYLAQNMNYACNASTSGNSNDGGSSNNNSNGNNNSSNSQSSSNNSSTSSSNPQQAVLGAATELLAGTGNIILLYILLLFGFLFLGLGLFLRKNK